MKAISSPHLRSTSVASTPTWWHLVILHEKRKIVGGAIVRGTSNPWAPHFRAACMCRAFKDEVEAISIMLDDAELAFHLNLLGGPSVVSTDRTYTAEEAVKLAAQFGIEP